MPFLVVANGSIVFSDELADLELKFEGNFELRGLFSRSSVYR